MDILRSLTDSSTNRILEVGCGDGYLVDIFPRGFYVGIDLRLVDLFKARAHGMRWVIVASGYQIPFHECFDVVCAFDVVEHLDEDVAFFTECLRVLTPGGRIVVTTPASPDLWSKLDDYAGHRRRYTKETLTGALREAGFGVDTCFPVFRALRPLALLNAKIRKVGTVNPSVDFSVNPLTNVVLRFLTALEWRILGRRRFGLGTSLCAIARKLRFSLEKGK